MTFILTLQIISIIVVFFSCLYSFYKMKNILGPDTNTLEKELNELKDDFKQKTKTIDNHIDSEIQTLKETIEWYRNGIDVRVNDIEIMLIDIENFIVLNGKQDFNELLINFKEYIDDIKKEQKKLDKALDFDYVLENGYGYNEFQNRFADERPTPRTPHLASITNNGVVPNIIPTALIETSGVISTDQNIEVDLNVDLE